MNISTTKIRREFPTFRGPTRALTYLDSAATSLTPTPVLFAMDAYYKECRANVHRGLYATAMEAEARYETARAKVATFISADSQEIIFTSGATASLNMAAQLLTRNLGPRDEVVVTILEHHSNLVPWQQLAKERGFKLRFIELTPELTLDMNSARRVITKRTKVVATTIVSNALGTVAPVKEIARLAHRVGALVVVDAAQAVGHRTVNVHELGCDFLALSGHKMFGPTGTGVLFGRVELLSKLEPVNFGGDMILSVTREASTWNDLPWKFEAGTPNIAGVIGLGAAVDFIERIGLKNIARHDAQLVKLARRELEKLPGVTVIGPAAGEDCGSVVSFVVANAHPHDLTDLLAKQGVAVRGGHHCAMPLMTELDLTGLVRASFSIYNDEQDVAKLVSALKKAIKVLGI